MGIILAIEHLVTVNAPDAGSIVVNICRHCPDYIGHLYREVKSYFSLTPQQLEEIEDSPKSATINGFLAVPERLLATILIANNLVNVTIVILCSFAFSRIFEFHSELLSFIFQSVLLTFLILLFGEILPKLYANTYTVKWAKMATGGIGLALKLFSPLSSMLVKSSSLVNRVVTKRPRISRSTTSRRLLR